MSATTVDVGMANSYSLNNLIQGRPYYFYLTAYSTANLESTSSQRIYYTPASADTQAPTVPQNLLATALSPSSISFGWTASTDNLGVASYRVRRNGSVVVTSTNTTVLDTGLIGNTTYSYSVSAVDLAGNESGTSTTVNATTPPFNLNPPSITSILDQTINANGLAGPISFTVADVESPALNLTVSGSSSNLALVPIQAIVLSGSGAARTVTVTPAANSHGTTRITLTVSDGQLTASTSFNLTVIAPDTQAPTVPQALAATALSASSISLTWTASTDNLGVAAYRVHRNSSHALTSTNTTVLDAGLTGSTTYAYTVSAVDIAGNESGTSTIVNATTPSLNPNPPSITSILDQTINANGQLGPISFTVADVESPVLNLTVSGSSSNLALVPIQAIVLSGSGAARMVTVTPATNSHGTTRITLTVSDGQLMASTSFNLTVTPLDTQVDPTLWLGAGFEEQTGSVVLDVSPNENDGILTSGVVRSAAGRFGRALEFTGSSGRVDLGGLDIPGSALTIACWFRADDFGISDARLVSKATGIQENDHYWMLSTLSSSGTKPRLRLKTSSGNTSTLIGTVNLSAGAWTHLAATYDGALMRLFVNGQPAGSVAKTGLIMQNPAVPAALGDQPQGGQSFDGLLDEVRIYTRALSQTELQTMMNVPLGIPGESDTQPPTVPQNLVATLLSSTVNLSWTASTDNVVVAGYRIYRGGVVLGTNLAASFVDLSPQPGMTYSYQVTAFDALGNASGLSTAANVTTPLLNLNPPTISSVLDREIDEDGVTGPIGFTVADVEIPAQNLTVSATSSDLALVPIQGIVLGGSGATRTVSLTPAANRSGNAVITLTVSDGPFTTMTFFVLTVKPVNDVPFISALTSQTVAMNSTTGPLSFTIGDVESVPAFLTVSGGSSNPGLTPAASIVFGGTGAERTMTLTPAANSHGTAMITVTVFDGVLTASTSLTLTVSPPPPDTQAPTVPQGLAATALSPSSVTLVWTDSTDNVGVAFYRVYRDGLEVAVPVQTGHIDTGLLESSTYSYVVRAVDAAGNESQLSTAAAVTTPEEAPLYPNLWLGMGFEEDIGSAVLDVSPNENDGILTSGAVRSAAGRFGRALEFTGSSGRVDLGGLDIPGSALTIACWFRADDFGISDARLVSKATGIQENDHYWMLSTLSSSGTKPRLRLKTSSGNTSTLIGTVNLSAGVWTHLAATYDGALMRLFVNGQPAGSVAKTGLIMQNPAVPAALGDQPQGGQSFDGLLDEVRIYTRALSQTEIQGIMTGTY